jgi:hypothetical protein
MRNQRSSFTAFVLFAILTLLMTYPTVFHMGSGVKDPGDPLLNTWIMAWNAHKILSLDVKDYFNANIFYPHKRTLAYSELLFTQSLIALPLLLITRNPVFAYNFCLLFSFFTSGLGMFFLARYLTRSSYAGMVSGIIFAFSPFMFAHLGHMQIITAGGIPLAFLFLHKFFASEKYKHLLLFTLFFLLQVLANGYYAMYLSLFAGLYIFFNMVTRKRYSDWHFWIKMAIFLFAVLAVAGPFFSQYALVRSEMGFVRKITSYASVKSFLAASPLNRIYGDITMRFSKTEGQLFPGILAFMLAAFGVLYTAKKSQRRKPPVEKHVWIYLVILVLSVLFTFGPNGPYILLYKYVPGFNGLRVASRFHIMVMFSLAVLAAFGTKALLASLRLKKRQSCLVGIFLSCLLLVEYMSIPIPIERVRVKEDIPEVYKWLATQKDDFALIELPLPKLKERIGRIECPRMHYSTYHWKKLVNGYSGFFPPVYNELRRRWQNLPLKQNIHDLKRLGVRYVVVHSDQLEEEELNAFLSGMMQLEKDVRFVSQLERAYVYELIYSAQEKYELISFDKSLSLPKNEWIAFSNVKSHEVNLAYDGDLSTRWDTGPQKKGYFFELDLGQVHKIRGFSLKLGTKLHDYPRGYRVEVSTDKKIWETVAQDEMTVLPIKAYLQAKDLSFDVVFYPVEARYIKIINTGEDEVYYWSIYEMDVFR